MPCGERSVYATIAPLLMVALWMALPKSGLSQAVDALDWKGKFRFHAGASMERPSFLIPGIRPASITPGLDLLKALSCSASIW